MEIIKSVYMIQLYIKNYHISTSQVRTLRNNNSTFILICQV